MTVQRQRTAVTHRATLGLPGLDDPGTPGMQHSLAGELHHRLETLQSAANGGAPSVAIESHGGETAFDSALGTPQSALVEPVRT